MPLVKVITRQLWQFIIWISQRPQARKGPRSIRIQTANPLTKALPLVTIVDAVNSITPAF